jgi:Flp pilus assembly protein TadG
MTPLNARRSSIRRFLLHLCGRAGEEQGQSLVELAFTLPLLLVVLVGTIDAGRVIYAAIEVANAARAGVAYGAQNPVTASDLTGMQTAALKDGPNVAGLNAQATELCTCSVGTAVTCANAARLCITPGHVITNIQVKTTAAVNLLFNVPGLPRSYTLSGQAIMRVE